MRYRYEVRMRYQATTGERERESAGGGDDPKGDDSNERYISDVSQGYEHRGCRPPQEAGRGRGGAGQAGGAALAMLQRFSNALSPCMVPLGPGGSYGALRT